jgi:hypothetical protein
LIIGLLVVGCGKQEQTDTDESTPTTTAKPVKELTAEEKVIGTYENRYGGTTYRISLYENGSGSIDGERLLDGGDCKWEISNGEIIISRKLWQTTVWRINKDDSLTNIANIDRDGEREELSETFKKINHYHKQ